MMMLKINFGVPILELETFSSRKSPRNDNTLPTELS